MTTGALQDSPGFTDRVTLDPASAAFESPPRSFARQVVVDTFRNYRARAGAVWIGVLVLCGVFAPFLASSHPLLMKKDGHWSSPLLRHLTAPDVVLLITFLALVMLIPLRRMPHRILIFCAIVVATVLGAWLWVAPPGTIVYSAYREDTKAGRIESAIYAPIRFSANDRQDDLPEARLKGLSSRHWLGTDGYGSDVLSRIIHASRIALAVGFISTGIAVLIGIVIGGFMGYFVGRMDLLGMRLIEIFEAIPTLFLLITVVAFFGRNLYLIMAIIGLTSWTGDARFVRGEFLRLRGLDFVQAARAAGLPLRSILFRHMLPNGIAPLLVAASFGVASAILTESVLSFLGLGLVEEPSWGGMLDQARTAGRFVWWLALFPGLAIFLTVFAYNLIGESLRDALDPKLRGT